MSDKYIKDQQPSTKATLNRDPSEDAAHFFRGDPKDWKREVGEKAMRPLSLDEVLVMTRHRQKGGYKRDSTTITHNEAREKAIEAFLYTPAAVLRPEEQALVMPETTVIEPTPKLPVEEAKPYVGRWDSRLIGWLKKVLVGG
jgi:hypothetical protein